MENQDTATESQHAAAVEMPVTSSNSIDVKGSVFNTEQSSAINVADKQTASDSSIQKFVANAASVASVTTTEDILRAMQNQILELGKQLKDMHSKVENIPQYLAPKMSPFASLASTTPEYSTITSFTTAPTSASITTFANANRLQTISCPIKSQSCSVSAIQTQPTSTLPCFSQPPINYSHFHNSIPSNTGFNQVPSSTNTPNFGLNMPHQNVANYTFLPQALPLRKVQDLPSFNGQPEDWPIFYTAFLQSSSAYNYANLENNQRLQKSLTGEARETVKSLLIHPDNVGAIIEQLRFRFGRPEQLIRSQLNQVREIAPISENAISRLVPFATKVKNLTVFLQTINGQQHISNPTLLEELVLKLPMTKRLDWAKSATQIMPYPTILNFSDWLTDTANLICTVQDIDTREQKKRMPILHAVTNNGKYRPTIPKCTICQNQHKIIDCKEFRNLAVSERWLKVKNNRLCFSCLRPGHSTRECHSKKVCPINKCQKRHHELLHEETDTCQTLAPQRQEDDSVKEPVAIASTSGRALLAVHDVSRNDNLLFRVLPVKLYGPNKSIETYALLDEGSSITMLDADLIKELGLRGQQCNLNMQWVGGKQAQEPTVSVNVLVSGTGKKQRHLLRNVYGIANLNLPTQSLSEDDLWSLRQLKLQPYSNAEPKLLIGLDHCHLGLPQGLQMIKKNGPYAAKTELGWVVYGPTTKSAAITKPSPCLLAFTSSDDSLHELVEEYFSIESFGVRPSSAVESSADIRAKSILLSTTKKIGGRYQTGLLWKTDDVVLPDSHSLALKRLSGIERKMKRDKNFAAAYSSIIKSYVDKRYARKLTPSESSRVGPKTWYLPHFGVVNPNKPSKLRLVFDAAATVNGISLNSNLLKGPQQYQPLPSVLFHFREGAVAVCGDIKEMFHQILIQNEDRCAQRFLWRDGDDSRKPDVYEMNVMTFGAACSPCAAQYVKTINAAEYQSHHPRAVKAISDHHYVDDFVDSFETADQAIQVSMEVKQIHNNAGFELRNFTSNSQDVLNELQGKNENVIVSEKGSLETEKILGMFWQPDSDNFRYKLHFHHVDKDVIKGERNPSKRELLSVVMSIFDPMGFLNHFTIAAKLLMREVWRCDVKWDEPLPREIALGWDKWRSKLPDVLQFKVPRFYFNNGSPRELQLHIFVDASEDAFAAVAYWRAVNMNNEVETSFVCSKTKCAPLKTLTIPRLELQAAVLGVRLMKTILKQHSVSVSRSIIWSDSTTVIKWINSEHRRYKPFVAHRIAEILAATTSSNWRWVPTQDNSADVATRFRSHFDFNTSSPWLKGPDFLKMQDYDWPSIDTSNATNSQEDEEELRPKYALIVVSKPIINFNDFSSLTRLVRIMAWLLRFINRCRKGPLNCERSSLSAHELDIAEKRLCRQVQSETFSAEISQITCGNAVEKGSALHQLTPYIDNDGILRVYGRVDAASCLTYAAKRPVILPSTHKFTELVIFENHQKMKHQNIEATICEIRRKYWIPRLRQVLRKVISKCLVCKIRTAAAVPPMMGPLPQDRLMPFVRPFSYTGLDFFGPVTISIGRRTEKRWVALFTCLTVRAIHLEVAYDLSTDACILAIRNFINRRGVPVRIRSDNGTNFVGVNKEAKQFSQIFDCDRIQDELASKNVQWIFNCPANPSEGGIWERMVRCVKRVLLHTLKEVSPREHTLQCLIIEAENVVNSRPLTHLPLEPDQEEPLTPNHFLLGSANTAQTPSINEPSEKECQLRKQWRIARMLRDRFWKKWVTEFLPTLTRRTKWCQRSKPVAVGDLVFVCDVNVPRRQWCRGRIEKVYTGVDGQVRSADVRTSKGLMKRPTSKLAVLDLTSSESGSIHGGGDVQNRPVCTSPVNQCELSSKH